MTILTIRTDKPEAEVGLYKDFECLNYQTWPAHRQLAETIHVKIKGLLAKNQESLSQLQGIVVFQGPGSFTGLRIGLSVANALAYSLKIPIVTTQTEDWVRLGIERLQTNENDNLALPEYGSPPHITKQKR